MLVEVLLVELLINKEQLARLLLSETVWACSEVFLFRYKCTFIDLEIKLSSPLERGIGGCYKKGETICLKKNKIKAGN